VMMARPLGGSMPQSSSRLPLSSTKTLVAPTSSRTLANRVAASPDEGSRVAVARARCAASCPLPVLSLSHRGQRRVAKTPAVGTMAYTRIRAVRA
jgi:hypothetical protein